MENGELKMENEEAWRQDIGNTLVQDVVSTRRKARPEQVVPLCAADRVDGKMFAIDKN